MPSLDGYRKRGVAFLIAADTGTPMVRNSRYNFGVPVPAGTLLYNASSGAVFMLCGRDASQLASELTSVPHAFATQNIDVRLCEQLSEGGFIVDAAIDEVDQIKKRFMTARKETAMVLTLTTTLDCNLGCYYCYEDRSADHLELRDVEEIVSLARNRLEQSGKDSLHVDWYGGEPLLNFQFLESASLRLQRLCIETGVTYSASIISNGTCWPKNLQEFILSHKIRQVQISFDGLRENHNRRRRYRKDYKSEKNTSSFDAIVHLIDQLLDLVRVDLRINIDRGNRGDVLPLIRFMKGRGWFSKRFPATLQPARLASYSDRSKFMRRVELTLDEYEQIRAGIRTEAGSLMRVEESEAPDGFPYPKTSVCAALAQDSFVVGADTRIYRCGLQVSEKHRAVGTTQDAEPSPFRILNSEIRSANTELEWWDNFDPTALSSCSRCSFLPICWGGCPKKHLDRDQHAIAEQGAYWRRNLPRLIAKGVGFAGAENLSLKETDQFR